MTSKTASRFWDCFEDLPVDVQARAQEKFRIWLADPFHPSLHFKEIAKSVWSVRISHEYRALAVRKGELVVWYWIGDHTEYERIIADL